MKSETVSIENEENSHVNIVDSEGCEGQTIELSEVIKKEPLEVLEAENQDTKEENANVVRFEITEIVKKNEKVPKSNKKKKKIREKQSKKGPPHQCSICFKKFRHPTVLKVHLTTHPETLPFSCNICKEVFDSSETLKYHLLQHVNANSYECSICNCNFFNKSQLDDHVKITHNGISNKKTTEKQPFVCPHLPCRKITWDERCHEKHLMTHESSSSKRNFECSICGQKFKYPLNLKRHISVHAKQKPFVCQICEMPFSRKVYLDAHMATHTKLEVGN